MVVTTEVDAGAYGRHRLGHSVGGDLAVVHTGETHVLAVLVDSLGHGHDAHAVALQAGEYLDRCRADHEPEAVVLGLHAHLKGSIGAAATACRLELASGTLRVAGVGNVALRVLGGERYAPASGLLGERVRHADPTELGLGTEAIVVLHTDGVSERFVDEPLPELLAGDARKVAQRIVFRHGKDHDDATCIVVRYRA